MATDVPVPPPTPTPPPGPPPSAGPRPGGWMRWLLVASLALNLLVLGLVAGAALRDGPPGPGRHPPRPGDIAIGPVAEALGPEDKAAILGDLRGRPELAPFGPRARAEAFAPIVAALRADPFDAGALEAALEGQVARLREAEGAVRAAVAARVAAMTPEARAAFADRLEEAATRRGPGRD